MSDYPDERVPVDRGDLPPDRDEWAPFAACGQCEHERPISRMTYYIPSGWVCDYCSNRWDEWGWKKHESEW